MKNCGNLRLSSGYSRGFEKLWKVVFKKSNILVQSATHLSEILIFGKKEDFIVCKNLVGCLPNLKFIILQNNLREY